MKNKEWIIIFFILCCQFGKASGNKKNEFIKTINFKQVSKTDSQSIYNTWYICNDDSSFFKKDTISLYDNINSILQPKICCDFIKWTFYKENYFLQSSLHNCTYPSSETKKEYYSTNILLRKKKVIFIVYDNTKKIVSKYFLSSTMEEKGHGLHPDSKKLVLVKYK